MFAAFRERGRKREEETNTDVREAPISCLPAGTSRLGMEPATFGVHQMILQPTEPLGQGFSDVLVFFSCILNISQVQGHWSFVTADFVSIKELSPETKIHILCILYTCIII